MFIVLMLKEHEEHELGLTNQGLEAKAGPPPAFINKVLLGHSHAY